MRTGDFEYSYQIETPLQGRQLVIPDIHGCSKTFKALINKIELKKTDQLFLLGDYINKGPNSAGVLNQVLDLIERGFQVLPIRGNHEQMLLDSHERSGKGVLPPTIPRLNKGKGLRGDDGRILPKYLPFIENLPYYFELERFYLVHAGFNVEAKFIFRDYVVNLLLKSP